MADLPSLARSLAEEIAGNVEFGTDFEDAARICLDYLVGAVRAERSECLKVVEGEGSYVAREIAARLRARDLELDVPFL